MFSAQSKLNGDLKIPRVDRYPTLLRNLPPTTNLVRQRIDVRNLKLYACLSFRFHNAEQL